MKLEYPRPEMKTMGMVLISLSFATLKTTIIPETYLRISNTRANKDLYNDLDDMV